MDYLSALRMAHAILRPRFYVEIGCWRGTSLQLAECASLAIDPSPGIEHALTQPTRIYAETSDAFFARHDVAQVLGAPIELSFIDGMHNVEFALRDFMNLERYSRAGATILIDDVLPDEIEWATRIRETRAWTGDIYKLIPILRRYRPDLDVMVFDVEMKGLAVISNLDPSDNRLFEQYDSIERDILAGAYEEQSVEAIRSTLSPVSAARLTQYLRSIGDDASMFPAPGAERYLDLLKKSLLNEIYLEDELRLAYLLDCLGGSREFEATELNDLRGAAPDWYSELAQSRKEGKPFEMNLKRLGYADTMMGKLRLDSLHECLDLVQEASIPGDLIECGVWRGGGSIFMAGYLEAHGIAGRRVIVADSFEGLPVPTHDADMRLDFSRAEFPELAIPLDVVKRNFEKYDLMSDAVAFLPGWFRDTLKSAPTDEIAVLRLDGDLYESTLDGLEALYDKVSPGGVVIVDDYGAIGACRKAVEEFFEARNEAVPDMVTVDWTGVWWIKEAADPVGD